VLVRGELEPRRKSKAATLGFRTRVPHGPDPCVGSPEAPGLDGSPELLVLMMGYSQQT
jgi:hypothetical protein